MPLPRAPFPLSDTGVKERNVTDRITIFKTKHPGRAGIAVRDDGRIVAIAGWDGSYAQFPIFFFSLSSYEFIPRLHNNLWGLGKFNSVRVHSAGSFKPLAILDLHKDSVYAVAFAPLSTKLGNRGAVGEEEGEDEDEDEDRGGGRVPRAWLAAGGKDERISLWEVYPVV
jgi:hypothetical protein